jgi:hypothetical protein
MDAPSPGRRSLARQAEEALRVPALEVARQLDIDSVSDNAASELSAGQKKLLEIGRVLMAAGGLGNNWGAVVGAFAMVFCLESTRFVTEIIPWLSAAAPRGPARVSRWTCAVTRPDLSPEWALARTATTPCRSAEGGNSRSVGLIALNAAAQTANAGHC